MAHALPNLRARIPPDAVLRLLDATLRAGFGALMHERDNNHRRPVSLDADTMRDIGAARRYQDYGASANVSACAERRLHRIAEAGRWASPR